MKKFLQFVLLGAVMLVLTACGGNKFDGVGFKESLIKIKLQTLIYQVYQKWFYKKD